MIYLTINISKLDSNLWVQCYYIYEELNLFEFDMVVNAVNEHIRTEVVGI